MASAYTCYTCQHSRSTVRPTERRKPASWASTIPSERVRLHYWDGTDKYRGSAAAFAKGSSISSSPANEG